MPNWLDITFRSVGMGFFSSGAVMAMSGIAFGKSALFGLWSGPIGTVTIIVGLAVYYGTHFYNKEN